jgi:hypothetical protein
MLVVHGAIFEAKDQMIRHATTMCCLEEIAIGDERTVQCAKGEKIRGPDLRIADSYRQAAAPPSTVVLIVFRSAVVISAANGPRDVRCVAG